jgi:Flp pilus assembly protein TadD
MQFEIACQHLQRAIVLNPSQAKYRHSLGCAYEAVEQWTKATNAFQHAVDKDPFNTKFLMSLVKPLNHLKRFTRVVEVCTVPALHA